jgi:hypothetical protein
MTTSILATLCFFLPSSIPKKYPYHTQSIPIRNRIKNCNFCPSIRTGYVCTRMICLRVPVPGIDTLPKKLYQYILGLIIQNDLLFLCLP